MTSEYIFKKAEEMRRKCGSRNPYDLLDYIGAEVHFTQEFSPDGLKGYCTIIKRIKFAVINAYLDEPEKRIVAGHEGAHLILHTSEIYNSPVRALKDFHMFNETGIIEYQANLFLADFLLSDEAVMETISEDNDFFSSARALYVPPELLAFKQFSMNQRNFKVQSPLTPDGKFLAK